MSYSFYFKAANKEEANTKIVEEFDKVVTTQPVHQADKEQAVNTAKSFIAILSEPAEDECIMISMSGSLGWKADGVFNNANISFSSYITKKEV